MGEDEATAVQAAAHASAVAAVKGARRLRRRWLQGAVAVRRAVRRMASSGLGPSVVPPNESVEEGMSGEDAAEASSGEEDEPSDSRQELGPPPSSFPQEMIGLLDQLCTFAIAIGVLFGIQLLGLGCWKFRSITACSCEPGILSLPLVSPYQSLHPVDATRAPCALVPPG